MATIREENSSLSRASRHLAVVTASGAQKNKLSQQRHSSVPMLSFDTDSSISTKFVFHNKRQSLVAGDLPIPNGQTDKDIRPT